MLVLYARALVSSVAAPHMTKDETRQTHIKPKAFRHLPAWPSPCTVASGGLPWESSLASKSPGSISSWGTVSASLSSWGTMSVRSRPFKVELAGGSSSGPGLKTGFTGGDSGMMVKQGPCDPDRIEVHLVGPSTVAAIRSDAGREADVRNSSTNCFCTIHPRSEWCS
jgi:hypothetical protein